MISTKEIEEFKTKGYVVIRDFINQDEIKELSNSFQQSKKSKTDEEIYNVIDDEKIWKLLCNTKLKLLYSKFNCRLYLLNFNGGDKYYDF